MAEKIWVRVDDPDLQQELRELVGGDPHVMKLAGSDQIFSTGAGFVSPITVAPTPPAAAEKPAGDAAPAPAPSGSGYPAEALTAALGTAVDSKVLWEAIDDEKQPGLAEALTISAADARLDLLRKSAWATAPEMALLDLCAAADRPYLAKKILRTRTAITFSDDERRAAQSALERQKVVSAERANAILEEGLEQMQEWRRLASLGKWMLIGASIFSALAIIGVLLLAGFGKLGDVATPTVIFALALFAISPAVLLLRERPLEGLDKWTPSGSSGGEDSGGGDSEGGTDSKSGSTSPAGSAGSSATG